MITDLNELAQVIFLNLMVELSKLCPDNDLIRDNEIRIRAKASYRMAKFYLEEYERQNKI